MTNGFLIIYITCQGLLFATLLFMVLNRDFSAQKTLSPSWVRGKIRIWRTHPAQPGDPDDCVARSATQGASTISKPSAIAVKSGEVIS